MAKKKVCNGAERQRDARGAFLARAVSADGSTASPVSEGLAQDHELSLQRPIAEVPQSLGGLVLRKAPRPSGCSRFVRREIADAMPSICAMLLTRVIADGDLGSLKLLLQMAAGGQGAVPEGTPRSTGFGRKILVGFKEFEARESGMRRES